MSVVLFYFVHVVKSDVNFGPRITDIRKKFKGRKGVCRGEKKKGMGRSGV